MKKLPVSLSLTEKHIGWIYWPLQLFVLPVALTTIQPYLPVALSEAQLNFVFFALNFLGATAIFFRFLIQSGRVALERPLYTLQSAFFGYGLFWICSVILRLLTVYFFPDFSNLNNTSILELAADNYTLTAIGTVLLAPVAEELIYRGLIFDTLHPRSPFAAFFISTVFFAAIHVVGYITLYDPVDLILCFVQYIPAGLCLGWAYTRSGSIWAPILAHIAINQTSILTLR